MLEFIIIHLRRIYYVIPLQAGERDPGVNNRYNDISLYGYIAFLDYTIWKSMMKGWAEI